MCLIEFVRLNTKIFGSGWSEHFKYYDIFEEYKVFNKSPQWGSLLSLVYFSVSDYSINNTDYLFLRAPYVVPWVASDYVKNSVKM